MRPSQLTFLVAAALLASACATDPGLGDAVRHNMAAQIIDPDPTYRGTPIEAGSGDRAALAMRRYREGRVLDPRPPRGESNEGFGNQNGLGAGTGAQTPR